MDWREDSTSLSTLYSSSSRGKLLTIRVIPSSLNVPLTNDKLSFNLRSDHSMAEVSQGVKALVAKHGGKNFEFSASDAEADALWQGRKTALWSVLGLLEDSKVWTTDVW